MAVHTGLNGVITIDNGSGDITLAAILSCSVNETAETVDASTLGSTARVYLPGITSWDGAMECQWDDTQTQLAALNVGSEVTLKLYPTGTDSSNAYGSGAVILTTKTINISGQDSMITASFTFQGTGPLTWDTV